ncbi:hypothetical protein [Pseudodesulfovibrio sp.]|uniref:hypothetical protein n=1 Tax=unclassified Pseudodesulfovibrio TaxID=2661612 RepID=UPI003B00E106
MNGYDFRQTSRPGYREPELRQGNDSLSPMNADNGSFEPNLSGQTCPLCKNHCPLSNPSCPKGEAYARSNYSEVR